ncbi:MAG: M18 family aminopeptidase [Clostridia bacterium]|nr:M18 family aminopeptidase [Clostridia bacterium]
MKQNKNKYKNEIKNFLNFLDATPSTYLVIEELRRMLDNAGAEETDVSSIADLIPGKLYYVCYQENILAAFVSGAKPQKANIAAAHTDYPLFKIKAPTLRTGAGTLRINVELYGGTIFHTWMDRALKVCGRVYYESDGGIKSFDSADFGPRFVIPNASLHMNRGVNDGMKFSVQNQLLPVFGLGEDDANEAFLNLLCSRIAKDSDGAAKPLPADIKGLDLSVVTAEKAFLWGNSNEFINSAGLDDRGMVYAIFSGLAHACGDGGASRFGDLNVAIAFNNEECGSGTFGGAKSVFPEELIKLLCAKFAPGLHYLDFLKSSLLISADMGHATHPSFQEFADPVSPIIPGKGIVLKTSWNQSYSTDAGAMAAFRSLCERSGIPYQVFTNNSDRGGGGTIGPILSSKLGIRTCDVGNPLYAMHSLRESEAAADQITAAELFEAFFA